MKLYFLRLLDAECYITAIGLVFCALYLADTHILIYKDKPLKETVVYLVRLITQGMCSVEAVVRSSRDATLQDALATSSSEQDFTWQASHTHRTKIARL